MLRDALIKNQMQAYYIMLRGKPAFNVKGPVPSTGKSTNFEKYGIMNDSQSLHDRHKLLLSERKL